MLMEKIKAVLFDVDGTLVESNEAHAKSWEDAFKRSGLNIPYRVIKPCIGMGGDHLLPRLAGIQSESEKGRALSKLRGEIFRRDYLPHLKPLPGADKLLKRLGELGYKLVIATSASKEDGSAILKKFGFDHLVDNVTNSSDADNSKPEPDLIKEALRKAGVDASEAIMVGDTPYDVEAAVRAGVKAIAFTSGGWKAEELSGAERVFSGPEELANQLP